MEEKNIPQGKGFSSCKKLWSWFLSVQNACSWLKDTGNKCQRKDGNQISLGFRRPIRLSGKGSTNLSKVWLGCRIKVRLVPALREVAQGSSPHKYRGSCFFSFHCLYLGIRQEEREQQEVVNPMNDKGGSLIWNNIIANASGEWYL